MIRRSFVEQVMGLPVSVLVRGDRARSAGVEDAVRRLYDELHQVDRDFSPYRSDSWVSQLSRGECGPADCPPDVRKVARLCEQAWADTGGSFDARRPDGSWDPSGLVKGWAVGRAARHLARCGDDDWLVNAGGDIRLSCPSGEPFGVAIADPLDSDQVATVVRLRDGAVATSGTAARGAHLYDPATGRAATGLGSVTVVGPDLCRADVLATAAYVRGEGALDLVAPCVGYSAMVIDAAGGQHPGRGWPG